MADSYTSLGNSVLSGSVTANDTLNGATVTAFQNPSNSGGTVAIGEPALVAPELVKDWFTSQQQMNGLAQVPPRLPG